LSGLTFNFLTYPTLLLAPSEPLTLKSAATASKRANGDKRTLLKSLTLTPTGSPAGNGFSCGVQPATLLWTNDLHISI